jgi:hypothetical protein
MKQSRGKARIGAIAVLGAVASAMLACAGCFDTAPSPPPPIDPLTRAYHERDVASAASDRAYADAQKACIPAALDHFARECERVCPIDLPLPVDIKTLTTKQIIGLIPKKCLESHSGLWLGEEFGPDESSPYPAQAADPCEVVFLQRVTPGSYLGLLRGIDPACDAAIDDAFLKQKAANKAGSDIAEGIRAAESFEASHPDITCIPIEGGGFNCFSY